MHVFEAMSEFFFVSDKPIPELMLPEGAAGFPQSVQPSCRNVFYVLKQPRDGQRSRRLNQGMPVVRHQHISAECESQPFAGFCDCPEDHRILHFAEVWKGSPKSHGDKEDAACHTKPMEPGHSPTG